MMHDNDLERFNNRAQNGGAEWLIFTESLAKHKPASDICVVKGASGEDCGIMQLINLMQSHGTRFVGQPRLPGLRRRKGLLPVMILSSSKSTASGTSGGEPIPIS